MSGLAMISMELRINAVQFPVSFTTGTCLLATITLNYRDIFLGSAIMIF